MSDILESKLLFLNQIGLIPGPCETEEAFLLRANYCQNLNDCLPEEIKAHLLTDQSFSPHILNEAAENLRKRYDCSPRWIPLFFNNYKLPFWHGGCAWIFQMTEQSSTAALIQLRQSFNHSQKYLGIYDRNELLTHELSHIGRMMFQEPKFEEILAYRTANSSFRRWFGPIIQSSTESALFMLLLFVLIVFDFFLIALSGPDAFAIAFWLKLIPFSVIIIALLRLWKRQKIYKLCVKNLEACIGQEKAEAVAYRLKDQEIHLFSKFPQEIKNYAKSKINEELRWKVIYKAYFVSSHK